MLPTRYPRSMPGRERLVWLLLGGDAQFPLDEGRHLSLLEEGPTSVFTLIEGPREFSEADLFEPMNFLGDVGFVAVKMILEGWVADLGGAVGGFHSTRSCGRLGCV